MKMTNVRAFNYDNALRGMRNPKESWDKSDTYYGFEYYDKNNIYLRTNYQDFKILYEDNDIVEFLSVGPKDLELVQKLVKGGPEHRKFLRQIFVTADVTAPLYVFKEFDTYKVSTTANSTSTMHKLTSKPITLDCFEIDDYQEMIENPYEINPYFQVDKIYQEVDEHIDWLESLRQKAIAYKGNPNPYWKELVRWLPESWLQTRTWTANFEVIYNMEHQRSHHKLTEWQPILKALTSLPYYQEFTH